MDHVEYYKSMTPTSDDQGDSPGIKYALSPEFFSQNLIMLAVSSRSFLVLGWFVDAGIEWIAQTQMWKIVAYFLGQMGLIYMEAS